MCIRDSLGTIAHSGTKKFMEALKQKTAYEMESRDWSSDVCSSDLFPGARNILDGIGDGRRSGGYRQGARSPFQGGCLLYTYRCV